MGAENEGLLAAGLSGGDGLDGNTLIMDGSPDCFSRPGAAGGPASLSPGSLIAGRYRIERELGRGGFGIVYQAFDEGPLKRSVALKVIHVVGGDGDDGARVRRQLLDEARTAGGLSHPNIATVYDVAISGADVYMTQALIRGEDLQTLITDAVVLPLRRALDLARQIAEGLAHAHEAGIVHRDLKPGNVLVAEGDRARITDFGLAQAPHTMDGQGNIVGTPGYMAPEQITGAKTGPQADLFAFGCVLYQMVTGRPPFSGPSLNAVFEATLRASPRPASQLRPDLPAGVEHIIERCLCKDPAGRYPTARALLEDLQRPSRVDPYIRRQDAVRELSAVGPESIAVIVGDQLQVGGDRTVAGSVEGLLVDYLSSQLPTLSGGNSLRHVAHALESQIGREGMTQELSRAAGSEQLLADAVTQALAPLPVPLVITTRYDLGLDQAMAAAEPGLSQAIDGPQLPDSPAPGRSLVHLFGSRRKPGEMVVTDDDLWDFYRTAPCEAGRLREALSGRCVVMVGFDAEDESFRQICQHVVHCGTQRGAPVYLITRGMTPAQMSWASRRGIKLVRHEPGPFLQALGAACADVTPPLSLNGSQPGMMTVDEASRATPSAACTPEAPRRAFGWLVRSVIAVALMLGAVGWWVNSIHDEAVMRAPGSKGRSMGGSVVSMGAAAADQARADGRFAIAIAPLWGMNQKATEEGQVLRVLAERALQEQVSRVEPIHVVGKVIDAPIRSHREAREVGRAAGVDAILWGEVIVLGETVEVQPYVTRVDPSMELMDGAAEPLTIQTDAKSARAEREAAADALALMGVFVIGEHYTRHNPGLALEIFRGVRPETADSLAWQGEALLRQGLFDQAELMLLRAQELNPDQVCSHSRLGWLAWYHGDVEGGLNAFRHAVELAPQQPLLHLSLARMLLAQGEVDEGIFHLLAARDLAPSSEMINRALIEAYLYNGRMDEATAAAEALRGQRDGEVKYPIIKAWILGFQGQRADALAAVQAVAEAHPDNVHVLTSLAREHFQSADIRSAMAVYAQVLALEPSNLEALVGQAMALEFSGRTEEASQLFRRTIQLHPHAFSAYQGLSRVLVKVGRHEDAVATLKEALRRAPSPTDIVGMHSSLGQIHSALGQFDEAIASLSIAIKLLPVSPVPYLYLGTVLEQAGRLDEAVDVYNQGLQGDSEMHQYLPIFAYLAEARHRGSASTSALRAVWNQGEATQKRWPGPVFGFLLGEIDQARLLELAATQVVDQATASLATQEAWYYIGMKHRLASEVDEARYWLSKMIAEGTDSTFEARAAKAELSRLGGPLPAAE